MKKLRLMLVFVPLILCACSTAQYVVESPTPDPVTGKPKVLQSVTSNAPGGDSFVIVVYYGSAITPTVNAGADSSALVNATAAAGQDALNLVQKALLTK